MTACSLLLEALIDDKDRSKTEKTLKLQTPSRLLFNLLGKFFRRVAARSPYSRHFGQEKHYLIMEKDQQVCKYSLKKGEKRYILDKIQSEGNPSSCRTGDRTMHIPANQLIVFHLHVHKSIILKFVCSRLKN